MFTSGSQWNGDTVSYSIAVGRRPANSDYCTVFTAYIGNVGNGKGVVLAANPIWDNPGSNSAFQDSNGRWWAVYAARIPNSTTQRFLFIDPLTWTPDDWVEINPQPAPAGHPDQLPGTPTFTQQGIRPGLY